MRAPPVFVGLLLGVLLGWGAAKSARPKQVTDALFPLQETQDGPAQSIAGRRPWKEQAQEAQQSAHEIQRLRAEVSRLRRQLAEDTTAPKAAAESVQSSPGSSDKSPGQEGALELDDAPPAVRATLAAELGDGELLKGIYATSEDGVLTFGAKGRLADGRMFALRLAENGTIVEKHTELPAEALPADVQAVVTQSLTNYTLSHATEILDRGKLSYDLVAKGPAAAVEILVRSDGTVAGYSAKFKSPEINKP